MQELPDTFTRADLIAEISRDSGHTKAAAGHLLDLIEAHVSAALVGGLKVRLLGLGGLEVKTRAAREGTVNGHAYSKPAVKKVTFKASKALKDAVNTW